MIYDIDFTDIISNFIILHKITTNFWIIFDYSVGDGSTALIYASMSGDEAVELVQFLCENGADINAVDDDGDSAMYYAETVDLPKVGTKVVRILNSFKAQSLTTSGQIQGVTTPFAPSFQPTIRLQRCGYAPCNSLPPNGRTLSYCKRCKSIAYCNKECQTNDWPRHKPECIDYRT